jgi:3'-phosphoadenosine 5'-phosphosulfate sulfotransferase (PAPS reductase)/FAD synthetase
MSWCCTVFKTGPLNNMIHSFAKDKKLLTFYGIRGVESIERNKYQDVIDVDFGGFHKDSNVSISPKITQQLVTSPIFEWLDIDIWLYILTHNLDFNEGYRLGFSRVGCWCCPNDSKWSEFLARIYIPDQYKEWNNFLIQFASKIGKPDPEVYVKLVSGRQDRAEPDLIITKFTWKQSLVLMKSSGELFLWRNLSALSFMNISGLLVLYHGNWAGNCLMKF